VKRYKLTAQDLTTYQGFKIPGIGVWFYAKDCKGTVGPCSPMALHHYSDPLLAILTNPAHANIKNPRLFEIQIAKEQGTDQLKGWSRAQKLIREIPVPIISVNSKITFAIYCAKALWKDQRWNNWADNWLTGVDRSYAAAVNASNAAANAANAATYAAAYAAAYAANAATYAANAAIYAAIAANAATYAANAANANAAAVNVATSATYAATYATDIDFAALAHKAFQIGS
jgi:hypothetical protein